MTRRLAAFAIALIASAFACGSPEPPTGTPVPSTSTGEPPTRTPTQACRYLTDDEGAYQQTLLPIVQDFEAAQAECGQGGPGCLRLLRQVESSLSDVEPAGIFVALDHLLRQDLGLWIAAAEAEQAGDFAEALDLMNQASTMRRQAAAEADRLANSLCMR